MLFARLAVLNHLRAIGITPSFVVTRSTTGDRRSPPDASVNFVNRGRSAESLLALGKTLHRGFDLFGCAGNRDNFVVVFVVSHRSRSFCMGRIGAGRDGFN
jgi:hypothetical protein